MNKIVFLILFIVFLIVVLPLLKVGYIFSIDQVLNSNWWIPKIWDHIYWIWILSQIFIFFNIQIWILEKIIIIITIWLPLLSWFLLFKKSLWKF